MSTPENFEIVAAVAEADSLIRAGDQAAAITRLERAVRDDIARGEPTPARSLYIRLAGLYRTHERYQDELALLDGYVARHPDDTQRTRFRARLSKLRALIGSERTSSVVPVAYGGAARARQSRVRKRLLDHDRRADQARTQDPEAAAQRLRQRAEALVARAAVALERSASVSRERTDLLRVMDEHAAALKQLVQEYGVILAESAVPREEVRERVRGFAVAPAAASAADRAALAANAEQWCLMAYDQAAA